MSDPRRITAELSAFSPPTATILPRPSEGRGQSKTATSNTLHSLSFGDYVDPRFHDFGSLCGLNEITLAPMGDDAAHTHRNVEIITYVTSGQISSTTMAGDGQTSRLRRGDAQVLTTGHGLTHQERASHTGSSTTTHLLQAYVVPWAHALGPAQQHLPVGNPDKRQDAFAILVSPCVGGVGVAASTAGQAARLPAVPGSMPINADFLMAAAIIDDGKSAVWFVGGGGVVDSRTERHVYVHVVMGAGGSKVRLADQTVLGEGDGAFVTNVSVGDKVVVESAGVAEVEVVVLDSA